MCFSHTHKYLLFTYLGFASLSTHCIGHIMTGSFMGRGNQYIQLVKVLYCKLPTNGKQLPAFPLEVGLGFELQSQRWEVRVLPLCHRVSPPPQVSRGIGLNYNIPASDMPFRGTTHYEIIMPYCIRWLE